MYIRYTQPPSDLYDWYEEYLQDDEEVDVKAGSGQIMTIGQMLRQWLVKLDWFSTLFPRIPVPIQKSIEKRLGDYSRKHNLDTRQTYAEKEMNKRRGEERESLNDNRDYIDDSRGSTSSSTNKKPKEREYWGESKEYRSNNHDYRRNRSSRSRSRSPRDRLSYRTSSDSRDKYRERSERDKDYYKERGDYRGEYYESGSGGGGSSSSKRRYRE